MERRTLYLYRRDGNYDEIIAFLRLYDNVEFKDVVNEVLIVESEWDFTLSDFYKMREFILEELLLDFVGLFVPHDFDIGLEELKNSFKRINMGIYDVSSFITEICMEKHENIKQKFKSYYYSLVGIEIINTVIGFVENNFNASLTSKKLFLHRNTLNYRLENFVRRTEIDIKQFRNGLAIYLLFRR
jgi:hypothetical protein